MTNIPFNFILSCFLLIVVANTAVRWRGKWIGQTAGENFEIRNSIAAFQIGKLWNGASAMQK